MAPTRSSIKLSQPPRAASEERGDHDARWGDRFISAPTYQKPDGEPVVAPAEWASPASTLVDSSPELGSDQAISPVESRGHGPWNTLTITIPLPWKRRSRSRDPLPSARLPPPTPSEFVSPEEMPTPAMTEAFKPQRNVEQIKARMDARAALHREAMKSARPLQSPRDLKSPMFPLTPLSKTAHPLSKPGPQPMRNVDILTAELDAMATNAARSLSELDTKSPIDGPTYGLAEATQSSKTGTLNQIRSPVQAPTPLTASFPPPDGSHSQPASATDQYGRSPIGYSPINAAAPLNIMKVLTPVEEMHERNSQATPRSNNYSGPASPLSPGVPVTASLTAVVLTPRHPTDPRRVQYAYVADPHAPLRSHPTERPARNRASSLEPASRRRMSMNRGPGAATPIRRHFRDSRLPAGYLYDSARTADMTLRSRSLEPTPSPRFPIDAEGSPTDSSESSGGSTDLDESTTDEDPLFSPNDPQKYFEARQMWNGVAGEGKNGFYKNVMHDYRLIGKDVSTAPALSAAVGVSSTADGDGRVERGEKPIVVPDLLRIVGSPDASLGVQTLVPNAEELWG